MKKEEPTKSKRVAIILGGSIIAAAWLIVGPDTLLKWGIKDTANDLLVWIPVMVLYFGSIAADKRTLACERRVFNRLIGR